MTSCVNRNCSHPLGILVEGRLFHFEITSISISADDCRKRDFDEVPHRKGVYFWLCGSCAEAMTLILDPVAGLQLVPLEQQVIPGAEPARQSVPAFCGTGNY